MFRDVYDGCFYGSDSVSGDGDVRGSVDVLVTDCDENGAADDSSKADSDDSVGDEDIMVLVVVFKAVVVVVIVDMGSMMITVTVRT